MTRYVSLKRSSGSQRLATLVSVGTLFLLWFAFAWHAAAATISIPGAVSVTIQPPEAVADGARWSVDGGTLQASGASVTNLSAGTHSAQFSNLSAWREPDTMEVLVIGGKQATVTATYRRLSRFYFRDVPDQRARAGQVLEFLVHTDEPGDPSNPGPGAALQMTANPPPAGALAFDPTSGRVTYTPAPADRLPFTVRFVTGQGVAGSFELTPLNALPLEASVIEYDRPLPNEESRDYITITESRNPAETFNDADTETISASISGKTLVFAANHPAHLYEAYNGRFDVKELHLFADRVIIRSPLLLPQTRVTIHARELRFEADGRIETTPRTRTLQPAGATWEDNRTAGIDGIPGHPAGDVDLFIERFVADSTTPTRFVMRGGNGGPAGQGRHGRNETDVIFLSPDWTKLMDRAGNRVCETDGPKVAIFRQRINEDTVTSTCGSQVSAKGERAVRSGIPGAGGRGGVLRSTVNLSAQAQLAGGNAGAKGFDYVGGILSTRAFVHRFITTMFIDGKIRTSIRDETAPKVAGANAVAPNGIAGAAGSFQFVADPGIWLHSFSLRGIVQFAKDAYINGRIPEARSLLSDYRELLRAHPRVLPADQEAGDAEFSEAVNLDQLVVEVENLLHRIDSNLDYFGNPAGWVPMLSFEANFLAFQNEIEQSIPILYLTYWMNNATTNLAAKVAATAQAKADLESERDSMEAAFNEAQFGIPSLKSQAETITVQIANLRSRIAIKLADLEQRARENVEDRHKLPFWKKALGVLSVAADLIPIGQPTVGRIGAGIGLLAQVDPDKPLESAKAIAPQAFGVMTNKNISVCFGTNSVTKTNVTGSVTNSPSGTNSVKKAKQDRTKQITECAKFLGGELKELAAIFKDAQVDDAELAAELEKLKASDTVLQELTIEVEVLNAEKERFAQQLAAALQVIGSFSAELAENLVTTQELEDRLAFGLAALDHNAVLHIKEMERRSRDRLIKFQYFLAKSFQYRRLRPYSGNLQLTRLFDRFRVLVEASNGHLLSQGEFDNLKNIFIDELREIVSQSLDNANAPARSFPKSYRLNASQLQTLNEEGRIVLGLKDLGLIESGDENVRLADLRTRILAAHPVGPVGSLALVRVNYEHLGISRLTSGGRAFLFRHYQTEQVNPIVWNAIFDALSGQMVNSTLTAAQQSLISVLLAQQPIPPGNLLFFTQPAADAEILLTKNVSTDNGTDFVIDDLVFEIQYDFNPTSSNMRDLTVRVSDDLAPVITVSQQDLNGRQDGQGDFSRVFAPFTVVALQAPPTYGQFVFDRWFINNQPQTAQSPVVAVFLTGNTQVEARYRLASGPLVLTPVAAPAGQVGFRFTSEPGRQYTVEQTVQLNNPIWSPVETRTGDGSVIQITRSAGTNAALFFRLRVQ
jgi:hypothetical protein